MNTYLIIILSFCLLSFDLYAQAEEGCNDLVVSDICKNLSELVHDVDKGNGTYNNYIGFKNRAEQSDTIMSWGNAHCDKILDDCHKDFGFSPAVNFARDAFGISFFNEESRRVSIENRQSRVMSPEDKARCSCIESTMAVKLSASGADLDTLIDGKIHNITENVFKSFGKKMINDYAHIYEDGMFFLNHSNVLNPQKTDTLLCRGAAHSEKAVSSKCSGIGKTEIDKRMKLIFSELDFDGATTLEDKLRYVDFHTIHRKAKDKKGNELTYLRSEYDKTRYGLKQTHEFQVVDKMLTNLLSQKGFGDRSYGPGFEVISTKISELLIQDFDGTMEKIFNNQVPKKLVDEWREIKKRPSAKIEFEDRFTRYLLSIAPSHPGLSAILLDSNMFSGLRSHLQSKKVSSAFFELENNFNDIEDYMENRCQRLAQDFAEVVCIEEENILSGLSQESLLSFATLGENDVVLTGLNDVIMCRGGQNSIAAFEKLNSGGSKIVNSDLFLLLDKKEGASDGYSTFAHNLANNSSKGEAIGIAAQASEKVPQRKTSYDPLERHYEKFKKDKIMTSSGTIAEVNGVIEKNKPEFIDPLVTSYASSGITDTKETSQNLPHFTQAISHPSFTQNVMKDPEAKEILDHLSHRNDKEEINSHLGKLENQELQDLKEFRRNVLNEREESLKSKIDQEKKNLEELRVKIENLTSGKNVIEGSALAKKEVARNAKPTTSSASREVPQELRETVSHRVAVQDSRVNNALAPTGAAAANLSFGASSSAGSAAVASRSISNSTSTAMRGGESVSTRDSAPSRRGLVVQESVAIANNKQEITKNIVEYLKGVDSETFLQFTKEGVVYKYKTVENGVLVDKEIYLSVNDVDPQALAEIVKDSEIKLNEMQRKYSYEALRIIISEEALKL